MLWIRVLLTASASVILIGDKPSMERRPHSETTEFGKTATNTVGKEVIETRWIFTVRSDGRKKARLVAKGYQQRMHEFDQTDTFSSVVYTTNLRIFFILAALNGLIYPFFDVRTAFLNGTVEQEIYMMPEGYPEQDKACLLKKAL